MDGLLTGKLAAVAADRASTLGLTPEEYIQRLVMLDVQFSEEMEAEIALADAEPAEPFDWDAIWETIKAKATR